jgi:hypothetical protein
MQGPIIIGEYFMSETEQDAHLGSAVREHAEAIRKLESLMSDAETRRQMCDFLFRALNETSAEKLAIGLSSFLAVRTKENFDWSKFTPDSLSNLASGLKAALQQEKETAQKERRLKGESS